MKIWYSLFCWFWLGPLALAQGELRLEVVDGASGETLLMAEVRVFEQERLIAELIMDVDGRGSCYLEPGEYRVRVDYPGYWTGCVKGVLMGEGAGRLLTVNMAAIADYPYPSVKHPYRGSGMVIAPPGEQRRIPVKRPYGMRPELVDVLSKIAVGLKRGR